MAPASSALKVSAKSEITEIPMLIGGQWRTAAESDEVFRTVSASRFGLQTGVFTKSMEIAIRAVRNIRTGDVILNGSSTWRTDQLACGGVKESGIGREGPHYSIRDMTEERLVLLNL